MLQTLVLSKALSHVLCPSASSNRPRLPRRASQRTLAHALMIEYQKQLGDRSGHWQRSAARIGSGHRQRSASWFSPVLGAHVPWTSPWQSSQGSDDSPDEQARQRRHAHVRASCPRLATSCPKRGRGRGGRNCLQYPRLDRAMISNGGKDIGTTNESQFSHNRATIGNGHRQRASAKDRQRAAGPVA